jgi:propanol-preferring alcohol dehydrogenase
MKAMILHNPQPIENRPLTLIDLKVPEPKSHEILIENVVCGICHTDLHIAEGELPLKKRPVIPGHQVVGMVIKKGSAVKQFHEGDMVGVAWLHSTCGSCTFCRQGSENLCESSQFTGLDVNGGYAQFMVIPAQFAYSLPEKFSPNQAAPLLCAGIIGYRALRLSKAKKGELLGLYGFGASAHVTIQVARHWECKVFVFTRGTEHQNLARKLGASWVGHPKDEPPEKLNSAIIFAPAGSLVLDALEALQKGGTLALAGIYMSTIPEMDYVRHLYHEKTIRSVANSTRADGKELLALAVEIPIHTEIQRFSLQEANEALLALKTGKINGAGILEII